MSTDIAVLSDLLDGRTGGPGSKKRATFSDVGSGHGWLPRASGIIAESSRMSRIQSTEGGGKWVRLKVKGLSPGQGHSVYRDCYVKENRQVWNH